MGKLDANSEASACILHHLFQSRSWPANFDSISRLLLGLMSEWENSTQYDNVKKLRGVLNMKSAAILEHFREF